MLLSWGCWHLAAVCDVLGLHGGGASVQRAAKMLRSEGALTMSRVRGSALDALRGVLLKYSSPHPGRAPAAALGLGGARSLTVEQTVPASEESAVNAMVEGMLVELQRYKDVLAGVLPPDYVPAGAAALHDDVASWLTMQMIGAAGFTEDECSFLPRALGPLVASYPPVHAPSSAHRRLTAVLRMLDGTPLADFPRAFASGGEWSALFAADEVVAVVRAVFADSQRRAAVLAQLEGS